MYKLHYDGTKCYGTSSDCSEIVVGPSLSLYKRGLSCEITINFLKTFLIRDVIQKHFTSNIIIGFEIFF